jgi:acetyl esterase
MPNRLLVAPACVATFVLFDNLALAQRPRIVEPARPTYADVSYGPDERNNLDFYRATSEKPAPLLIYFHGGGFVAGDKRQGVTAAMVQTLKKSGVHFASINYRFVDGKGVIFPAPLLDGARAVQFLRTKADEWNIDSTRLACFGDSAGAGIAMWIGFHDDLADPNSDDPVLRQSTRVVAVGDLGGQATYDPIKVKELIGGRAWEHPSTFTIFGLKTANQALHPTPALKRLYDETAAITWLTKDDPPVFMIYTEPDGPLPPDARPGDGIHHPKFGRLLKKEMDKLGIENVFINEGDGTHQPGESAREMFDFFLRHLGVAVPKQG